MDNKTASLIQKLKDNKALAEQIMQSSEGQQLLNMLSQNDGGQALNHAAEAASQGNTQELATMLSQMMKSPNAKVLMERLNEQAKK